MSKRRHASSSQLAHLASRLVALPRLFEPFYRVSEFCDHQTDGTGLGLSIAQRIAIIHDGSIRARNRDDGGLEMEIRLPSQNPVSAPPYSK